ncbi:MAG: hypothetical protein CMH65_14645 [Nevskiales bacterium]|nr:hypothetical protein [Nevskiales bacterium]
MRETLLVVGLSLLMLSACELVKDDVARAERNCQRAQQEQADAQENEGAPSARRCGLIRATCDMDRRGPACQALLERYQ